MVDSAIFPGKPDFQKLLHAFEIVLLMVLFVILLHMGRNFALQLNGQYEKSLLTFGSLYRSPQKDQWWW